MIRPRASPVVHKKPTVTLFAPPVVMGGPPQGGADLRSTADRTLEVMDGKRNAGTTGLLRRFPATSS